MKFPASLFGIPERHSTPLQEAPREHFNQARETVLDELETAVVDANGKRFKEREITHAMKTVGRL